MKYHPRYIIFAAIKKYMTDEEVEKLKDEIGNSNLKQDRKFLSIIKKHFDLEILRSKPMIPAGARYCLKKQIKPHLFFSYICINRKKAYSDISMDVYLV